MAKSGKTASETFLKEAKKLDDNEQVVEFLKQSDHPLKEVMQAAREVILGANEEITEHIKWNAPSFCFNGVDRVTFNLHNDAYVLLVFHRGAKVKDRQGDSPLLDDKTGLLEWITPDRANIKLHSLLDLNAKKDLLAEAVKQWIAVTG
jgi:uncharacterized protein YdeI (YjbR/CyaY-like superfamily)